MRRAPVTIMGMVLLLLVWGVAHADEANPDRTEIKNFGLSVGNAYACSSEASRAGVREDAQFLFDLIVKDMGLDAGFVFATAAGYGAALESEHADCPRLLSQWDEAREAFGITPASR